MRLAPRDWLGADFQGAQVLEGYIWRNVQSLEGEFSRDLILWRTLVWCVLENSMGGTLTAFLEQDSCLAWGLGGDVGTLHVLSHRREVKGSGSYLSLRQPLLRQHRRSRRSGAVHGGDDRHRDCDVERLAASHRPSRHNTWGSASRGRIIRWDLHSVGPGPRAGKVSEGGAGGDSADSVATHCLGGPLRLGVSTSHFESALLFEVISGLVPGRLGNLHRCVLPAEGDPESAEAKELVHRCDSWLQRD